jgi:hypothetical protein
MKRAQLTVFASRRKSDIQYCESRKSSQADLKQLLSFQEALRADKEIVRIVGNVSFYDLKFKASVMPTRLSGKPRTSLQSHKSSFINVILRRD